VKYKNKERVKHKDKKGDRQKKKTKRNKVGNKKITK
jgi:hypothetical protein